MTAKTNPTLLNANPIQSLNPKILSFTTSAFSALSSKYSNPSSTTAGLLQILPRTIQTPATAERNPEYSKYGCFFCARIRVVVYIVTAIVDNVVHIL